MPRTLPIRHDLEQRILRARAHLIAVEDHTPSDQHEHSPEIHEARARLDS